MGGPETVSKRDLSGDAHYKYLEKRAKSKIIDFCTPKVGATSPGSDSSGDMVGVSSMIHDFLDGTNTNHSVPRAIQVSILMATSI